MIGEKIATGYYRAMVIIKLFNRLSMLVNIDAEVGD